MKNLAINAWLTSARGSKGASYLIMLLIMIIMPLHYQYLPPILILLFLSWLNDNIPDFRNLKKVPGTHQALLLLFLVFYLWQAGGLFYTNNLKLGWQNLFGRLSMVLFPIILISPADKIRQKVFDLLKIFSTSTALYLVSCFIYALFRSLSVQGGALVFNPHPPDAEWDNYFFYTLLTYSMHPSYLAMFAIMAMLVAMESAKEALMKKGKSIYWIVISLFLLSSFYFISSRAALLSLIIIIPIYSIHLIKNFQKYRIIWISLFVLAVISLTLIFKNEKVENLINELGQKQTNEINHVDDRFIIWGSAVNVLKGNLLLGVGLGDVRSELVKEYDRIGVEELSRERMNAHNQFLEVSLESGIIGLIIFLLIIGLMILIAVSEKNFLYGLFLIMIMIFFMFESVLYRFAGVSFFSLFSFLLLNSKTGKFIQ